MTNTVAGRLVETLTEAGVKRMYGIVSLWVLRAVMSGQGREVIDLASTNLLPR